jgi:hypothetical protein
LFRFDIVAVCAIAAAAHAEPITITHQGEGMGTIDAIPFDLSTFTIHASADTDNILPFDAGWFVNLDTASIDIKGVGTFEFITQTRYFVNNNIELVGFSRAGIDGTDLFNGPANAELATWDLTTSTGPHEGAALIVAWNHSDVHTDAGVLVLLDAFSLSIFNATVDACPADVNADGNLDILDFVAFQLLFADQDPAADCDANAEFNILDFVCFQQLFQAGC